MHCSDMKLDKNEVYDPVQVILIDLMAHYKQIILKTSTSAVLSGDQQPLQRCFISNLYSEF